MIPRLLEDKIYQSILDFEKVFLILGPRQVGKTTLIKSLEKKLKDKKTLYLNCDLEEDLSSINTTSRSILTKLLSGVDFLFIDEAQRMDSPGLTLKIIFDNFPDTKTVATGSSSFDLRNKIYEALTGRYLDFYLFPFSFTEVIPKEENAVKQKQIVDISLPEALLYGFYPDIYLSKKKSEKTLLLQKLIESYLFKDILSFQKIRNSKAIIDLVKALAYQIGSEINENELATRLKIDRKTVVSYLDILEKSFVVIRVYPYSKNPRREIGKNYKIYFVDNGIRNALIGDFNALSLRQDAGLLWENFLFIERIKRWKNQAKTIGYNFWRAYTGAEVDYIEKQSDQTKIEAFEFKYSQDFLSKGAHNFQERYNTKVKLINKNNYLEFI